MSNSTNNEIYNYININHEDITNESNTIASLNSLFKRQNRIPLEAYSRFIKYEQLENYANNVADPNDETQIAECLAYDGQIVSVYGDTDVNKNGIYHIRKASYINENSEGQYRVPAIIDKISGGTDISDLDIATPTEIESIFKEVDPETPET